ncbi:hypothetical protein GI582_23000 [Sulfitobacter sp. BDSS02]|nr:hypothetical protein [Sulfitobacter sp. BDSS02]
MIIKSSRIPTTRTRAIARYLDAKGDNETITWLRGSAADIKMMGLAAGIAGRVYAVRHIILSPERELKPSGLKFFLAALQREYGVSDLSFSQACVVGHQKRRAGEGRGATHFHIALPEFDLETSRVMDSRFTRMRDEKLARSLELRLHHPSCVGRFNREVWHQLHREDSNLDLSPFREALIAAATRRGLDPQQWLQVRAHAAFSTRTHQRHERRLRRAAQNKGLDTRAATLPNIRAQLRAWAAEMTPADLVSTMQNAGYTFHQNSHSEAWQVAGAGVELGSFHRLSGLPQDVCNDALERKSNAGPLLMEQPGKVSLRL